MLVCEQCGCSGELGMGWLTVVQADVLEIRGTGWMLEYCPECAASGFGYRRPVAPDSVPARESAPSHAAEGV